MRRIIICLLALCISFGVSAQIAKKKKKTPAPASQTDSSNIKKDNTEDVKENSEESSTKKFDYKSANKKAEEQEEEESVPVNNAGSSPEVKPDSKSSTEKKGKVPSGTRSTYGSKSSKSPAARPKPAQRPKPMTAKEKKQAEEEAAALEAATPKGVEALYYKFPIEYLPVVKEFMDYKQSESPTDELHRVRIKDDITMRKQIIRFKDVERGYMMLQKPGDTKYTKLQVYKMNNGNLIMAVEQSDCPNGICHGTLHFYAKSAGGWKDATDQYFPNIDNKFVIDRLRSAYKKEYKDLELYNSYNYEESDDNLKKAITYQISPDDGTIIIQEENLPCKLYSMVWDIKKEKFDLKKIEK